MNVAFVHTSLNADMPDAQRDKAPASWPPLGVLYNATFLREHGIPSTVFDQTAHHASETETLAWIERQNADVVGFSALNGSGKMAARLATETKKRLPDVTVVFGNYFPTFNAERLLAAYPSIDYVVHGEGEYTMLELAQRIGEGADERALRDVRGITFRNGDRIMTTAERELIKDLDSLPFPDRTMLDTDYRSTLFGLDIATKQFTTVLTSRGCAFNCSFCGCSALARRRWRARSPENVLAELQQLVNGGYRQFLFVDDNFTLNEGRARDICRRIQDERLDIEWICESRVDNCSEDFVRALVNGGCRILYLGIESGTQRMLDYYNKNTTVDAIKTAVANARKAGIDVIVGTFVLGARNETHKEIEETLAFAESLDIDVPQFNILSAFPGTAIWDALCADKTLDAEAHWEDGVCVSELENSVVTFDEIRESIKNHFNRFFLRPTYIAQEFYRTVRSPYRRDIVANALHNIGGVRDAFRQASQTW